MPDRRFAVLLVILLCTGFASAQNFEAFRLKSGMTPDQVSSQYPSHQFRFNHQSRPGTGWGVLVYDNDDIFASVSFCNNALVAVNRNIDVDTDLLPYIEDRIREFGQPHVTTRREPWTGPGGGDIVSLDLTWIEQGVKYVLSFVPEGRTGSGELRHFRNASVAVSLVTTPCMSKKNR